MRGKVEKGEGSIVMLVPRDTGGLSAIHTTVCGAGGAFEIEGVIPGDYSIVAFDHGNDWGAQWGAQWDALLSMIDSIATSLRVEAGSTATVGLRMNKWPW